MPEVRFEWESQGGGGGNLVGDLLNFAGNPATSALFGLLGKSKAPSPFLTIELDLETGQVEMLPDVGQAGQLRKAPRGVGGILAQDVRDKALIEAQLQEAYNSGDLEGVNKRYYDIAKQLAEIRRTEQREDPNVPAPPYAPPPPSAGPRVGPAPRRGADSGDRFVLQAEPTVFLDNPLYAPQLRGGGVPIVVPTIPPGGFAGFAQQTVAAQRSLSKGVRNLVRRRRTRKSKAAPRRRRARSNASKAGRFVKGSAAAKRHMAKLRRMRK